MAGGITVARMEGSLPGAGRLLRGAVGPILALHPNSARALVIDCHTHLNRYTPEAPPTLAERYASLRAEMDTHGIGYALVLSSYAVTPDRPSTHDILELVRDDPRIGVVAGVRYGRDRAEELAELRSLLEAGRIKGLKLYPGYEPFSVQEPGLRELYVLAGRFGVPVMIHTGDTYAPRARVRYAHPLSVDEAAVEFPDVTFVLCHLGNPWFVDAMEVVYKNENVVADISGLTLGAFEPRFERFALGKVNEVSVAASRLTVTCLTPACSLNRGESVTISWTMMARSRSWRCSSTSPVTRSAGTGGVTRPA